MSGNDRNRGLYPKYLLFKAGGDMTPVPDPFFALRYTTDPHARVALEAYADSCVDDYPQLAQDLYRALCVEVDMTTYPLVIDEELSVYLGKYYRGRWVALFGGDVVAAADSLRELRDSTVGRVVTVLYVPREGEASTR